jgi:enamine deaminase RidA (YjgF/YER057c/UK114 family)
VSPVSKASTLPISRPRGVQFGRLRPSVAAWNDRILRHDREEGSMAAKPRFLNPATLAPPPGYSCVVETTGPGRTIYVAGQLGLDLHNKLVGEPGDFRAQCERAFENLGHALAAVGATFADVVKINNYLVDMAHIGIFREMRDRFLNAEALPASTTVAISQLARPSALFEIEAIAVLPPAKRSARPRSQPARRRSTKTSSRRR